MCGRYTLHSTREALQEWFPLYDLPELKPRYNIAPTQLVAAARVDGESGRGSVALLRWGLVPFWAEDRKIGNRLTNARGETAAEKPAFRAAFKSRRCLVLADGFYEWQKHAGGKQPFHIRMADGRPFAFAGLWEHWDKEGEPLESVTILTIHANELMQPIHERMPVIVKPENYAAWLDPKNQEAAAVTGFLQPFPAEEMQAIPVSTFVNNARNEGPGCVTPLSG
jgi:putative SOS response-associated peptidase YedK